MSIRANIKRAHIIIITFHRQENTFAFHTIIFRTQIAINTRNGRVQTLSLNASVRCAEIQIITNHRHILAASALVAEVGGAGITIIAVYGSVYANAIAYATVNRAGVIIAAIDLRIAAYSIFTKILRTEIAIIAEDAGGYADASQAEIIGAGIIVIATRLHMIAAEAVAQIRSTIILVITFLII